MVDLGVGPKPTNKIVVEGEPLKQTLKITTVANMYPGRVVKKGSTDGDIQVCAATTDGCIGFLGYEHTIKKHRPATVDTIYLVNAQAAVLNGGHFVVVAKLLSSQTIVKGDRLTGAAAGCLVKVTEGGTETWAVAEESVTSACTGTGCDGTSDIMVRSII